MDRVLEERVAAVRHFNRFWTGRIGLLRRRLYDSALSLAEVRVLYELAHRDGLTAGGLARELDLDPGYLSRLLGGFERSGWLRRTRSVDDARRSRLAITAAGRRAFAPLDRASRNEIARLIAPLPSAAAARVVGCMQSIERALGPGDATGAAPAITLRTHEPGDIGWIIARHGALYAEEYGWDITFEALVAKIAARFVERYDPRCERCWIAERDGERAGTVTVVRRSARVAQLRLLLVEPSARGLRIGARLVDEAIAFARAAGYRRMMLWTNAGLDAARAIYDARGFHLTAEERHRSFGHDLVGQTFERDLR
jgi:DNA-binding MarR family transcriptional regulator/GNAT superfamily N-acetyltransferase